tara:strand:+ start:441 stop:899 length:459 start_codon:yes stop_codon:yes gene_type:complete
MEERANNEDYLPDIENKKLRLTRNEALYIDDNISMLVEKEPGDEHIHPLRPLAHSSSIPTAIELIEKIGHAILFTTDPKNKGLEAEIIVSDTDLFIIREIAFSYARIGNELVGYNLKRKIYTLLYSQDYQRNEITNNLLAQIDMEPKVIDAE